MRVFKAALIAGMVLASGGAMAQTFAPPPPPGEIVTPPAPGPNYVLQPGYYNWAGGSYVWVGPHWAVRRVGFSRWVPPHWGPGRMGRWHFVPGHWAR